MSVVEAIGILNGINDNIMLDAGFSHDGNLFASAWEDKTIIVHEVAPKLRIKTRIRHSDCVRSICFSPDGCTLASVSNDKILRLWNVENGVQIVHLSDHSDFVTDVGFSPDGTVLASASDDGLVCIYDAVRHSLIATLDHTPALPLINAWKKNHVRSIAFSPDSRSIATACVDGVARLWSVRDKKVLTETTASSFFSVAFTHTRKALACKRQSDFLYVCNLETEEVVCEVKCGFYTGPYQFWFSQPVAAMPQNVTLAFARKNGFVFIFNATTSNQVVKLHHVSFFECRPLISSNGMMLATSTRGGKVRLHSFWTPVQKKLQRLALPLLQNVTMLSANVVGQIWKKMQKIDKNTIDWLQEKETLWIANLRTVMNRYGQ